MINEIVTSSTEKETQISTLLAILGNEGARTFQAEIESFQLSPTDEKRLVVLCAEEALLWPTLRIEIRDILTNAINALIETNDHPWVLRGLSNLAQMHLADNQLSSAKNIAERIATEAERTEEWEFVATSKLLKAQIKLRNGNNSEAAILLDEIALTLKENDSISLGPKFELAVLALRVISWETVGNMRRLEYAVTDLAQKGESPLLHYHLAVLYQSQGQRDKAIASYIRTLDCGKETRWFLPSLVALSDLEPGDGILRDALPQEESLVQEVLARNDLRKGRFRDARTRAEALRKKNSSLILQAEVFSVTGPRETAVARTKELLDYATSRKSNGTMALANILLARSLENIEEQDFHLSQAKEWATASGNSVFELRTRIEQAWLELKSGDMERLKESARYLGSVSGNTHQEECAALSALLLGFTLKSENQLDEARKHVEKSLLLARKLGFFDIELRALEMLGQTEEASLLKETTGWQE